MKTTAPFMAPTINGGSATKTNTVRTFVLVELQVLLLLLLLLLRLLQFNLNDQWIDLLFTMVCQHKSRYFPTRIDPINRILPTIIVASSVVHHIGIPHIINTINIVITIITTNSCQLNALTLKKKLKWWTTYLKALFWSNSSMKHGSWDGLTISMTLATMIPPSITTSFSCVHTASAVYTNTATTIVQAKYDKFSPQDVVNKCVHLAMPQQEKLLQLLTKFSRLFSGSLGRFVHTKFSIQLTDPSTPPIFCTIYSVPLIHQKVFQQELEHLISKKVLRRIPRSEWAFPTFLIPKKMDVCAGSATFDASTSCSDVQDISFPIFQQLCQKGQVLSILQN